MAAKGPTRRRSSVAMLYMVRGIGPTTELDLAKFPVPRPPLLISSGKWVIVLDRLVMSVIGLPNNCIKAGQRSCQMTLMNSFSCWSAVERLLSITKMDSRYSGMAWPPWMGTLGPAVRRKQKCFNNSTTSWLNNLAWSVESKLVCFMILESEEVFDVTWLAKLSCKRWQTELSICIKVALHAVLVAIWWARV